MILLYNMKGMHEFIQSFEFLFLPLKEGKFSFQEQDLINFPLWLRSAINLYTLNILGDNIPEIILIEPKGDQPFDTLINIYRQVSLKCGPGTILIANELNPKFRPLLVKFRIPFIYKNKIIFAPQLGLVSNELHKYKEKHPSINATSFDKELHPLSVKLVAAYLCTQIPQQISLKALYQLLITQGVRLSLSKLSKILNELIELGFMEALGRGPHKEFRFKEQKEVWEILLTTNKTKQMSIHYSHYSPKDEQTYILAGESALAEYSDLASPNTLTIAVDSSTFRNMLQKKIPLTHHETEIIIQVWKEDPKLFSINKKINPIELYFSLKDMQDERIQLALKQMLHIYDIN